MILFLIILAAIITYFFFGALSAKFSVIAARRFWGADEIDQGVLGTLTWMLWPLALPALVIATLIRGPVQSLIQWTFETDKS